MKRDLTGEDIGADKKTLKGVSFFNTLIRQIIFLKGY